jgi:type IX secretion system substrate protein
MFMMKSIKHLITAAMLIALYTLSANAQSKHQYFPLTLGYTMEWDSDVSPYTETIVSQSQEASRTWYLFDTFWRWENTEVSIDTNGDMYLRRNGVTSLWIKLNAKAGESWTAASPGQETWAATMISTNETITTKYHTYTNVLHIDFVWNGADNDLSMYYAPDVGPIKRILKGFGVITDELISTTTSAESPEIASTGFEITRMYPQPAQTQLNITVSSASADVLTFSVHDVLGRAVNEAVTTGMLGGHNALQIPTSGLEAGIYFLRISSVNGITTERFTVQ